MKLYKLIKRNRDCVLLQRDAIYKVMDIEADTIYMGKDRDRAESVFSHYDIEKERAERKDIFEYWLKENAES